MQIDYDYTKFKEWLLLKKYSPATATSVIRLLDYFKGWAEGENITGLENVSYSDALAFMQWCMKQGTSQKTIAQYISHIKKFYSFLMVEGVVKENPTGHIKVQGIKRRIVHDILSEGELRSLYGQYPVTIETGAGKAMPPQERNILSRKRNKVILGLLVYQGLRVEEVAVLTVQDLQLREGKITIHSQRRTAARVLALESTQVYELMDYLYDTRKQFLVNGAAENRLFLQWNNGGNFYGITQMMLAHLRKLNNRVKNFEQIRASVITGWLKLYDLRKVQYLAGHKYVSSTEGYKANVIDELQNDVSQYHPF